MNIASYLPSEFCIGCGVCVSVCPTKHLRVGFENNKLKVKENSNNCVDSCSMCISVCPFSNESYNEDHIAKLLFSDNSIVYQYRKEVGYFIDSYVGHHPNIKDRINGASGGVTTYILSKLFELKLIDAAIVVNKNNGIPYFSYKIIRGIDELHTTCRSGYCAIHVDEVLDELKLDSTINKVVITALPCISKGIRNACKKNKILNTKIKYIIGLVCGQTKSNNFANYLSKKNNIELQSIDFRTKKEGRPNSNFGVKLRSETECKEITFSSYAKEWSFRLFTPNACNFCDDIYAETADVVLMDAWLPNYQNRSEGDNLIVTRNKEIDAILKQTDSLARIGINDVIMSQSYVIKQKREIILDNLRFSKSEHKYIPNKRLHLFKSPNFLSSYLNYIKLFFSRNSDNWWIDDNEDYKIFKKRLKSYKIRVFIALILNRISGLIK